MILINQIAAYLVWGFRKFKILLRKLFRLVVPVILILTVLPLIFMELVDRFVRTDFGAKLIFWKCHSTILVKKSDNGIRYVQIGDSSKTPLFLVHGAMVSLLTWIRLARFKSLYDQYYLLIPERPGYGASYPGKLISSIERQAELLGEILESQQKPGVLLGHSYGAPIIMMMGLQRPDLVKCLIGVSGQYDPKNEIIYAVMPYLKQPFFKRIIPGSIWAANEEKLAHVAALEEITDKYPLINVPVVLVHGDEDALVLFENSVFLKEQLGSETPLIRISGKDHPIPVEATNALVNIILNLSNNSCIG